MNEWPWVVVPALLVALAVRVDARVVGPYFALSSIIAGTEGITARMWYEQSPLRQALVRRFVYPAVAGFLLGWTDLATMDIISVGFLAAGLLLWPTVFHGLPWFVPRHSWHLPALYATFTLAFSALAGAGLTFYRLLIELSGGNVRDWFLDQFLATAIFWAVALIAAALFRAVFTRTRDEAIRREGMAAGSYDGIERD